MAIDKKSVMGIVESMPDDATLDDLVPELYLQMNVEEGIRQLDAGEGIPHDEVKRRFSKWLSD